MALLTPQAPKRQANKITLQGADTNGDSWANTGKEVLLVENNGTSAVTLTFVTPVQFDGLDLADLQISIPAGETHLLGAFPTNYYNDSNGNVSVSYSSTTNVNVALLTLA